jgi:hypothetical protein
VRSKSQTGPAKVLPAFCVVISGSDLRPNLWS